MVQTIEESIEELYPNLSKESKAIAKKHLEKIFPLFGLDIFPNIIRVGDYTIVVIRTRKNGKPIEAIGFTRKSKKDEDNPDLAVSIAMGRAKKALELRLRGKKIDRKYMG